MQTTLGLFLAQTIVIVALARLLGRGAAWLGQPPVVGEMLAGILLGPTLLGQVAPLAELALFPEQSLQGLYLASQVGVILYLFTLGLELDPKDLRSHRALFVSLSGMIVPFVLGVGAALWILGLCWSHAEGSELLFALFMGVAMSITAFPVLTRILSERGIQQTPLGRMALSAAALGDVVAWSGLALLVTLATSGSWTDSLPELGGLVAFVLLTGFVARPLLRRFTVARGWDRSPNTSALSLFVLWAFACGLCTEALGMHALFGAFLAGVVSPGFPALRQYLCDRLLGFSGAVFLPLFFAYTGLRVQFTALPSGTLSVALIVILVAVVGKIAGCALPHRAMGGSWRDGVRLGILMNTRGLMELVALNIGLDLGILPPAIFSVMVAMALFTTLMTGPALTLWERWTVAAVGTKVSEA